MQHISFTRMSDGTREEYQWLAQFNKEVCDRAIDNVVSLLRLMQGPKLGYQIDRYQHSLQSATRAHRDGADEELVVCALLHDIGDTIAPDNHSQAAAAILRPFVSEQYYWIVQHHGIFQGYYYFHHLEMDRNARDAFKDHPHYEACVNFCEHYDQNCFDPDYDNLPLDAFEPILRRVFAKPKDGYA